MDHPNQKKFVINKIICFHSKTVLLVDKRFANSFKMSQIANLKIKFKVLKICFYLDHLTYKTVLLEG